MFVRRSASRLREGFGGQVGCHQDNTKVEVKLVKGFRADNENIIPRSRNKIKKDQI